MTDQDRESIRTLATEFEDEQAKGWGWTRIAMRVVVLLGFLVAVGAFYTVLVQAGVIGEQTEATDRPSFADVADNHPQREAIEEVAALDIMDGVSDDLFNPEEPITRAAFAKVVVNTMRWEVEADLHTEFEDVEERAYLDREDFIAVVSSKGVMSGIQSEPPMFGPDEHLQTGHAVIVFVRAARDALPVPDPEMSEEIAARSLTSGLEEALNVADTNELLGGTDIDPVESDMGAPITRAQVAALAANVRAVMTGSEATSANSASHSGA